MKSYQPLSLFLLLFFWLNIGFGQSKQSFNKLINETNQYLERYANLSPFETEAFISLDQSGLPKKHIQDLKTHYQQYEGYSKDSISEYNLLLEFQGLIVENLTHIIAHEKFQDNQVEELISQESDLSIVVSNDRKLYNFSLAEKTGGTYRSRISITHYTGDSVPPNLKSKDDPEIINQHHVFEGDGFDGIYTIETEQETMYVLTGYVSGCSSCFEYNLMLVSLNEGLFEVDFSYGISTRFPEEGGIDYNPSTKTIVVDYVTDDLTSDCYCLNYAEMSEVADDYHFADGQELRAKKCHCTFEFNGSNFELIKESWEKVKE